MKQIFAFVAVALMVVSVGCDTSTPAEGTATGIKKVVNTTTLCGKCGQVKGSDTCCKEDATVCGKCDFATGSPACCKVTKSDDGADIELCGCGQVKGSDSCCKEGAAKCDKCGQVKGSDTCCKEEEKTEEKTE